MTTKEMPAFPANCNPFNHDNYHMGTKLGTNCYVMYENHADFKCSYLIIVNTETGERLRVSVVKESPSLCERLLS